MIRILQNNSYQCSVSKRTVVSGSKTALVGVHEIQFARKKKNWIVGKKFLLDGKRSKMLGYDLEHLSKTNEARSIYVFSALRH